MTFGLQMPGVRQVLTYEQAVELYDEARDHTHYSASGERKLPGHGQPWTAISKRGTDIVFTYHNTDVVTRHKDGSITLDLGFSSRSTATFADRFIGRNVTIYGEAEAVVLSGYDGPQRVYRSGGVVRLTRDGLLSHPKEDTLPIRRRRVDRKKANTLRKKIGWADFVTWYETMYPLMDAPHTGPSAGLSAGWSPMDSATEYVADRGKWHALMTSTYYGLRVGPDKFLSALRTAINVENDCFYVEEHEYVHTYDTFSRWSRT